MPCDNPEFCWHEHYSPEIINFFHIVKCREKLYFNTLIVNILIFEYLNFLFLKVILINLIAILIIAEKLAALDLLKIKVFWIKSYGNIISVYDVTKTILLSDSNYVANVVMWQSLVALAFPWEKL